MALGVVLAGAIALVAWPAKTTKPTASATTEVDAPSAPSTPIEKPVRTTAAPVAAPASKGAGVVALPAPADLEPDVAARWSAIEAMVRDGDLAELPALTRSELAKEPEAAPAIIHGVASLAVQGSDADRALAGKTLSRWLKEERGRDTRDAQGNVVNVIEALGDLGGDEAVTSLIEVLDRFDREDDLALQTTAAERLATLGDRRALPAVERFEARVTRSPEPDDEFQKELRAEAIKTAADARARLSTAN